MTTLKFAALSPDTVELVSCMTIDRLGDMRRRTAQVQKLCVQLLHDLRIELRAAATYDGADDEVTLHLSHEEAVRVVTCIDRHPSMVARAVDAEHKATLANARAMLSRHDAERWREHEAREYARTWAERWDW